MIYDVGMQTGRMTRDEAIALMTDGVGFLRWAPRKPPALVREALLHGLKVAG